MPRQLFVSEIQSGKSVFVSEAPIKSEVFTHIPGFEPVVVWGTEPMRIALGTASIGPLKRQVFCLCRLELPV